MQKLERSSVYILRASFQWILHQALVADERYVYCGLIGSSSKDKVVIEKVAMIKDAADIKQTLDVWKEMNTSCLGFFYFEEENPQADLLKAMSETYLELKVKLSEKGRLDLFAFQSNKTTGNITKIDLDLIEDGHKA